MYNNNNDNDPFDFFEYYVLESNIFIKIFIKYFLIEQLLNLVIKTRYLCTIRSFYIYIQSCLVLIKLFRSILSLDLKPHKPNQNRFHGT